MFERATFAVCFSPAVLIADSYDEGMKFVVMLRKFAARRTAHARDRVSRIGRCAIGGK